jgi:hypothetical protein
MATPTKLQSTLDLNSFITQATTPQFLTSMSAQFVLHEREAVPGQNAAEGRGLGRSLGWALASSEKQTGKSSIVA